MRAGLSTIQQTMTPEASSVLNHSIEEAGRRNHGQTTPLHVAATLLASPSGFLRQACIRSHPNSSHPLQCRALELCFSVALERLPTAQNMAPGTEPPISNALMAALKRAQAHQRRGCPEQQQQPLLAVKVELEQLIISILDDPSVSRVMREASFSSPAVKATIEQSLNSQAASVNSAPIGIGFRPTPAPTPIPSPIPVIPNRNLYLNPRLQQGNSGQPGQQRSEEVKKVIGIMLRSKKRNPVLVGESEPEAVVKEVLRRIEKGEEGEGPLKNAHVIAIGKELVSDKTQLPTKIKELGGEIETRMGTPGGRGIVLDLGDLKWLVEQPVSFSSGGVPQQVVSETGRAAVAEMARILSRFGEGGGGGGRLWLIGTATCETYLRCQVYHTSMENDWDLQAVPITSRSPLSGMFPRVGNTGILGSTIESLNPLKSLPSAMLALPRCVPGNKAVTQRTKCCPQCTENYEQELAKLVAKEYVKSSSDIKSEAAHPQLPRWLQNAKADNGVSKTTDQAQTKDQEMIFNQTSQELQKKWSDACLHLHPNFHHGIGLLDKMASTSLAMPGLYNPNLLARQPSQPKLHQTRHLGETLQLNANPAPKPLFEKAGSPPGSLVRTDLALGQAKVTEATPEKAHTDCVKDFLGCIISEPQAKVHELHAEKFAKAADTDTFKKLLKGLMEKAWWQQEAASALATAVTRCRMGNGKKRGGVSKGDTWLLFMGPDRVAKKKMGSVLAEQICGANPITICLGSRHDDEESDMGFRGKTALDRIAEGVRRNPSSVIVLEDIDEADMLVRGSIRRAMERGRLTDSHGREISLGNVIFILTAKPDNLRNVANLDEKRFSSVAGSNWQLRLSIGEKSAKRRASWLHEEDRFTKQRKQMGFSGLSFDLNLAADAEDDRTDGSHNSSDLTIEHEVELGLETRPFSITSVPHELVVHVDDTIVFKPVNFGTIRREIENRIAKKFSDVVENKGSIELEDAALEKVLGGVWLGRTSLDEWAEKVLSPSFERIRARLPSPERSDEAPVVRLELDGDSGDRNSGDCLPSRVRVTVDGV